MKEVKLWFARNQEDEIITINEADKNNIYYCALCGSQLIPKALESIQVQPHFAHIDASKCTSEHMIHWWFKNKLLEVGEEFSVKTNEMHTYKVKDIDVEKIYTLSNNTMYKPDLTIETETGEIIDFELANTNKKKIDDYINIWIELNHIVVEVDIWSIINRETTGVFKALYYEGKVFSEKKKTQYQKNIGDYINSLNETDEKYNNRIKKLNWFWKDLCNYKIEKIDIETLMISIESIEKEDKRIIKDILKKPSCNNILGDIIEYTKSKIKNIINDFEDYKLSIQNGYYNNSNISIKSEYADYCISIEIDEDYDGIEERIVDYVKDIKSSIEHAEYFKKAKTNQVLLDTIEDFDKIYKYRDGNYHFYNRFGYGLYLTLAYNCNTIVDFKVPYYICDCSDKQVISNFFKSNIDFYFDTIEKCVNENKLYNLINKLDNIYKEIYILTSYSSKKKIIYNRYRFRVNIRKRKEDLYEIEFCKESIDGYDYNIKTVEYFKNKVNDISYDQDNLYKLKYQLIKIFNHEIIELKNKKKIDKILGKLP